MSGEQAPARTPQPGDHVEVVYRGTLRDNDDQTLVVIIDGDSVYLPVGYVAEMRVIDPPEPTTVGTVVTGWRTEGDRRPEAMYVFALTGQDANGDGRACWQEPGHIHEYTWAEVLEHASYGREVIEPPSA